MRVGGGVVDGVAAVLQADRFLPAAWISLGFVKGIVAGIAVSFDMTQSVSSRLFFLAAAASNSGSNL